MSDPQIRSRSVPTVEFTIKGTELVSLMTSTEIESYKWMWLTSNGHELLFTTERSDNYADYLRNYFSSWILRNVTIKVELVR